MPGHALPSCRDTMMKEKSETPVERKSDDSKGQSPPKKPYRKPEFRFEQVFETAALACGKTPATPLLCKGNRKRS